MRNSKQTLTYRGFLASLQRIASVKKNLLRQLPILTFIRDCSKQSKMSEIEMKIEVDEPAVEKTFEPVAAKKFANAQTQHGREETAEEENIVVLAITRSPVREESDEVVWHEDTDEVSSTFIYFYHRIASLATSSISGFQLLSAHKASSEIKSRLITHN